jgi:hypothetical protein
MCRRSAICVALVVVELGCKLAVAIAVFIAHIVRLTQMCDQRPVVIGTFGQHVERLTVVSI